MFPATSLSRRPWGLLAPLVALTLVSVAGYPARADAPDPLVVDLYFDLAADSLAESDAAPVDGEITIAGIPLRVATEDGDVGWRTVAGARGRYLIDLTDTLTFIGRAQVTTTDFVDAAAADSTVALAAGELRYGSGRWAFALQPGVEVTRRGTDAVQRDMIVEGRASMRIGDGLEAAGTARYRWRDITGDGAGHREIAFGRLGLVADLPYRARLDMGLVGRQETADVVTLSAGPSVGLILPLGGAVDLSANYGYTATARAAGAGGVPDVPREDLHRLGLAMSWAVGGDAGDLEMSAGYGFERSGVAGGAAEIRHVGTVEFAVTF